MITIKENTLKRINNWSDDLIHIVTDFDRTLTVSGSESSWGILSKTNLLPDEYAKERKQLYDFYRPIELDLTLDNETKNNLMCEWWNKHINLFIKYQLREEILDKAINDPKIMTFRPGAKNFLQKMYDKKIPVIIISAGIGNFIEKFLIRNNCYFDNIYIISNFIKFENGLAVGISDNIINSFNKNEASINNDAKVIINKRIHTILFGDMVSDILMVEEASRDKTLKIGFLEEKVEENNKAFEDNFDIVCTDNTSFTELLENLSIL